MESNFRRTTFKEVITSFRGGSSILSKEYSTIGDPVLSKGDIKPFGKLEFGHKKYIPKEIAASKNYIYTTSNDLLLSTRDLSTEADFLGLVAVVPKTQRFIINQGANIFQLDEKKVDKNFFVYWCNTSEYRNYIKNVAVGSTQIHLRKDDFLNAPLILPPINIQTKMVKSLCYIDEKIELNTAMNQTLEAMAQTIFKSWFVDFEPFKEGKFIESKLGLIPEGWEVKPLEKVIELAYGKALAKEVRQEGNIPVYGSGGITGTHHEALVQGPGIVVGRKGTVGSVYWVDTDFFPIDTVFYVKPKSTTSLYWIYEILRTMNIANFSADSAVPGVNRNVIYAQTIVIPKTDVLHKFDEMIKVYIDFIEANSHQIKTLTTLRDTLLPKLMSGEVRV